MKEVYCNLDIELLDIEVNLKNELLNEIEFFRECIGGKIKKEFFTIKDYGCIVILENQDEISSYLNEKLGCGNIESEQWIIENNIYYIVDCCEKDNKFIRIIICENLYRKMSNYERYFIERNLKVIKSKNGRRQRLSY
ncbi:hypothetical protein ACV3SS_09890 [Clostridium perfringens]